MPLFVYVETALAALSAYEFFHRFCKLLTAAAKVKILTWQYKQDMQTERMNKMALKYPELFKPFKIGKCEIKNRIVMTAMHPANWYDDNGILTDSAIDYYEARAKGGVGLIYTGAQESRTHYAGYDIPIPSPFDTPGKFVTQMTKLVNRVHAYGAKLFIQPSFDYSRRDLPGVIVGTPVSASACPNRWDPSIMHREITKDEIKQMLDDIAWEAALCKSTGCDGIDLCAYGSYLLDTFMTAAFNTRTDEYGGDLRGRTRIVVEMIQAIKEACGRDFPLSVKITTKHYMKAPGQSALDGEDYTEFGRDTAEGVEIAKIIEEAGADALYIANGGYDSFYWQYPPVYQKEGLWLNDIAPVTAAVSIPVIGGGKMLQPGFADDAIKAGKLDAVGMGRALLAEPDWANKAKLGKPEAIRPCIGCNKGCIAAVFGTAPLTCAVNPTIFYERSSALIPAERSKSIAIIGGGVAGMECARIAAQRGHAVTLFEKNSYLGGLFAAPAAMEFKAADHRLISWFERELREAGVKVMLNTSADVNTVSGFDEVVVANGAEPNIPPIPGVENANVLLGTEALLGTKPVGQKVVVIGGGEVGCETAIWLKKEKGKDVTIVELAPDLMSGAETPALTNVLMLKDMLKFYGVETLCGTACKKIEDDGVIVGSGSVERKLDADTVILCVGFHASTALYHAIDEALPVNVWSFGDAVRPSSVLEAVKAGNAVGRAL